MPAFGRCMIGFFEIAFVHDVSMLGPEAINN